LGKEAEVIRVGKYELDEVLGEGPLGKAYSAIDTRTGQKVVLRGFVRPKEADEEHWQKAIERFNQELTAVQRLEHPNIVRLIEFGESEGVYFIATEFFVGQNLRQWIDKSPPPSLDAVLAFLSKVSEVLDFAWLHGIAHGDITPYNLLFPSEDPETVKVLNYGVAHARQKLGSPYLAPEQLTGFQGDLRSDLYALGVVAYEWLTKRNPFAGETVEEVCRRIQTLLPPPIAGLPSFLNDVLLTLMAKDPARRYQSGEELRHDLPKRQCSKASLRESAVTAEMLWTPESYQPPPSLADYELHQCDLREIQRRLAAAKAAARRKRAAIRRWAIAAATFLGWGLILGYLTARYHAEGEARAKLLKGSASLLSPPSQEWRPLASVGPLLPGDFLRTNPQGQVILELADGSRLLVQPGTTLHARSLGAQRGKRRRSFALLQGRVFVAARPIYGGAHRFVLRCPRITVKVKGTSFEAQVQQAFTNIATLQGTLEAALDGRVEMIPAGQKLLCDLQSGKVDLQNLNDQEKAALLGMAEAVALSVWEEWKHSVADGAERWLVLPMASALEGVTEGRRLSKEAMTDAEAQATATTAIRALCLALEGGDEYPTEIGLSDLSGLGLEEKDARRILSAFEGGRLLSYRSDGHHYEFTARLKDSRHTLVRVRNGKTTFEEPPPSAEEE